MEDEVSMIPPTGDPTAGNNLSDILVEATAVGANNDGLDWFGLDDGSPLPLDASEGGLWAGHFVPPPPRPAFLDDAIMPDGVTTCDLCSWAWKDSSSLFSLDEASGELGWLLTLVIVSLISAVIGAVIMVTVLHWRRFKTSGSRGLCSICASSSASTISSSHHVATEVGQNFRMRERVPTPNNGNEDKESNSPNNNPNGTTSAAAAGVWSWLTSKKTSNPILTPTIPAENHYTHMDEAYAAVGEALYAELDRESNCSPAYQNTAYNGSDVEPDAPVSSAPSSAYYSDLSVTTTVPERAYEVVGMTPNNNNSTVTNSNWENEEAARRICTTLPSIRLSAINETVNVQPSDYV